MPNEEKPLVQELGEAIAAAILELCHMCNSGKVNKENARVVITMLEKVEKRLYGKKD